MSWRQWASVLKLSTTWGFHAVREKAITNITSSDVDAVDKIILSKQHDVAAWLLPALNELAQRQELFAVEDAERLIQVAGLQFLMQLWRVRESHGAALATRYCDIIWTCGACANYYCKAHNLRLSTNRVPSHDAITWPCGECTLYRCGPHDLYVTRPAKTYQASARTQHDFTSEIQKVYNMDPRQ
jgi:hypothetical protein